MQQLIEQAWEQRELLERKDVREAVMETVDQLDRGLLRVAEKDASGQWSVVGWVKKAILLYFPLMGMETLEAGPME